MTTAPKPIGSPAAAGSGVQVRITAMKAVKTAGTGIGETAGQPAVAFTVEVTNHSTAVLPVNTVAVTASYGAAATPAISSDGPPSSAFVGAVAPGKSASATAVFVIPTAARGQVTVLVTVAAGRPVVAFTGGVG